LTSTGAAGIAWNRIKHSPSLSASAAGKELRRQAQALVIAAAHHEEAVAELARHLHSAGIAPLHFKGWAVAQYYSQPDLRAMGDADLCAPPGRLHEMVRVLRGRGFTALNSSANAEHGQAILLMSPADWPGRDLLVDVHERLDKFYLKPPEDIFSRARRARLGDCDVLVPSIEDHLRIVAIHFLRDGGWRPSSLCDVGALLEALPSGFDWELCLGDCPRRRRWIACTVELAHQLLGARLDAVPTECQIPDMPSWLSRTVLRAWDKPLSHHRARVRFGWILRDFQSDIFEEVIARWPNGIRASVELEAAFSRAPRWPYQLKLFLRSIWWFTSRGRRI
jgi:hypothetical protein